MQATCEIQEQAATYNSENFEKLWKLVSKKTKTQLKTDPILKNGLKNIVLKFNDKLSIKLDKNIGGGHWSFVFLGNEYNPVTGAIGEKIVLKMVKPQQESHNPVKQIIFDPVLQTFHELSEKVVHINDQFRTECELNTIIHGQSEIVELELDGKLISFVLIPYLGDETLSALMKDPDQLARIPLKEWLDFFITVLTKLKEFHEKTAAVNKPYIHNDIKPANITLSTVETENHLLKFTTIELIDFGNAHPPHVRGVIGDLRYNPIVESLWGLLFPIKDERIDICAMGESLKELCDILQKYHHHPADKEMLLRCRKIFSHMTDFPTVRMPLVTAIEGVQRCKDDYPFIEERKKEILPVELNAYLIKLKAELKKCEEAAQCCTPLSRNANSLWKKLHDTGSRGLRTRIKASEKMLSLINGDTAVHFDEQQYAALHEGKLEKIISKYRLQGKLPAAFVELERDSSLQKEIAPRLGIEAIRA